MNPELPAEEEMNENHCPSWPSLASQELCPVADSNVSQPESASRASGLPPPDCRGPMRPMWMLVPGVGSQGTLGLPSSREWF